MKTPPRGRAVADPQLTPRRIYEHLDRHVIGQRRAKRTVSIAAYNHLKRCAQRPGKKRLIKKSNILMIGPTGCGKTHIARHLAELLEVPFTIADATEYTEAGYYGKDVEVMIAELLFKADHAIDEAQRGIVFVDEIDKIARRSSGARTGAGSRDIGGEGVQQALLKVFEGRELFVPLNVTQHWNKHDFVQMDTQDILFICAGTFSDLRPYDANEKKLLGFGGGAGANGASEKRKPVGTKELTEYGMLAELLGRLPVVVELDALSEDELYQVMTVPPDSVVREFVELLSLDDVEVRFAEDALREIVRYAIARKLGARGLRTILEEVCHDLMFDAPELKPAQKKAGLDVDRAYVKERLARLDGVTLGE
jgi:ATP-dependent Clp protease ATP-binding subunit ClpX